MSSGRPPLSARDYKNSGRERPAFDFARYQQFGAGLGAGLVLALLVWVYDHRAQPKAAGDLTEVKSPAARADKAPASENADSDDPASDLSFYDMLPKFEVTVPERDHGVRRDLPDEQVVQPGSYVLQVGSSHSQADAERLRDKLVKLGVDASVQHVTIDNDEWYRVRIGPISELAKLNATRKQLRTADIDAVIYRVGD
ncbi:MAG TPA: SPOR domain-containing protein [Steroidobacteraceae bacterium]|nr:SPOR domain-containing protein [Steroidobacteraceae bacterium]